MKIKEKIEHHKYHERNSASLAKKYAKTKDYYEAARWYRAADFHGAVWRALEFNK